MSNPLSQQDYVQAQRLNAAANATGNYPQVASVLASSDLSPTQINMVGSFVKGLDTATLSQLAAQSGASVNLSAQEKDYLHALGEDANAASSASTATDPRSGVEKAAEGFASAATNTGSWLFNSKFSPVHWLSEGLNQLGNAIHVPWRMLSSALDGGNDADVTRAMQLEGYDPNSVGSRFAFFWNKGDALFHDLSGVRSQFQNGDRLVDLAIMQHADPDGFAQFVQQHTQMDPTSTPDNPQVAGFKPGTFHGQAFSQSDLDLINSKDFQTAARLIDQQAISPGRDIAHVLTFGHTDNEAFHLLSGTLDAVYDIAADPTLIGGKVSAAMKGINAAGDLTKAGGVFARVTGQQKLINGLARVGDSWTGGKYRAALDNAMDTEGMKALLLNPNTLASQTASGFLADAKLLRETTDETQKAAIFARMNAKYKPYMPFLDEVNGTRVIPEGKLSGPSQKLVDEVGDARSALDELAITAKKAGEPLDPEALAAAQKRYDDAVAAAQADKDAALPFDRNITTVYGDRLPATKGKPIESLDDFANYMASTNGLLRMGGGVAAKREMFLPGRISLTTRLSALRAEQRAKTGIGSDPLDFTIDHSTPYRQLPHEAEESVQKALDGELSDAEKRGDSIYNVLRKGNPDGRGLWSPIKAGRAKFDAYSRRVSTLLPKLSQDGSGNSILDLTSASATENVRRFARQYLTKADADRLAAGFATANIATRRQMINGIVQQTFHASGLSRSEEGRAFMQRWQADQDDLYQRAYALNDNDVIKTASGDRHVAMTPTQISDTFLIPNFQQLTRIASKSAASGWMGRTFGIVRSGVLSPSVDALMGAIKLGWITTAAGGLRNAFDEVTGHVAEGNGGDWLAGKALYRQAKRDDKAATKAEAEAAGNVQSRYGGRVPSWARGARTAANVHYGAVLGKLARFNDRGVLADPESFRYAHDLIPDQRAGLADEHVSGAFYGEDIAEPFGNAATEELHRNGVAAEKFQLSPEQAKTHKFDGWKQTELDGGAGLDAWVGTMHQFFGSQSDPAIVALRALWEKRDAVGDVMAHMRSDAMKNFRDNAEILNTVPGTTRQVATLAEQEEAIGAYSQALVKQVQEMLTGRGRNEIDPALIDQMREEMSQGMRARHAAIADHLVNNHGELVNMAEEAHASAAELTRQHESLRAVHHAHAAHQDALDMVSRKQDILADAQLKLDRAMSGGDVDVAQAAAAASRVEKADGEIARLSDRTDKAATRRDNAKATGATAETRAKLQQRVVDARNDLKRAQKLAEDFRGQLDEAKGAATTGPRLNRLAGKVGRHEDAVARASARADDKGIDVLLAHHDTGLDRVPSADEVENAAQVAHAARQRASYLSKQVDTAARSVQAHTLNADHALNASHIDDAQVRRYLVATGRGHETMDGVVVDRRMNGALVERLLESDIPDAAWLKANLEPHEMPTHTVRPTWAPINPAHVNPATQVARGYTGLLTKAFHQVVEKPVQAFSRNPMRMAAYVQARKTLEPYMQHLVENGFSDEVAEQAVRRMANAHADSLVLKSVDNATVQTQFELLSRNWWAFVRAQGDWARRWARIVHDNPAVIRQAQLLLHGGESAGMVDQDPTTGQLTFVYPGSGYLINSFTKFAQTLGLPGLSNIPMMPDLRSNLLFLNPSADNPIGYSSTPVVSVPFHVLSAMMGSHYPLLQASADELVNGQLGAGRAWYEQFLPSWANRIYQGVYGNINDGHSQLGSAIHNAMVNLDAAGYFKDPRLAYDPTYRQHVFDALKTQTQTHMLMRALLGFGLPASPGAPTEDVQRADGTWVNQVSWTDHHRGVASMTDAAREVFGNMPYQEAALYWAKYHPRELPVSPGFDPETQAGSRDAVASATTAAAKWMEDHPDFVNNYGGPGGIATYFMPSGVPGSAGGKFSQLAYNAQVEQGMRQYISSQDQFNNLLVKNGESMYFNIKKQYDDQLANAVARGDKASAKAIEAEWQDKKDLIYATNPLLAQKFMGFAANGIMNTEVIRQLQQALQDPVALDAMGPDQAAGVAQMILASQNYSNTVDELKGQSSAAATAARSNAKSVYEAKIAAVTDALPGLRDLANGAFKTPA